MATRSLTRPLAAVAAIALLGTLNACTTPDAPASASAPTEPRGASFAFATGPSFVTNVSDDTTAQNETPVAVNPVNPQNLITGNNDWNYNDGCGVNASFDGGKSWTKTLPNGFIPGITTNLYDGLEFAGNDGNAELLGIFSVSVVHNIVHGLVGGYSGFGVHTTLNVFRAFPGHFKGVVFASIGVIDSGVFKGEESIGLLRESTEAVLARYVGAARRMGVPAASRMALGTDAVEEAEKLCLDISRQYPHATFFAGQVIFQRETWLQRLLHNQTAYAIQRRLQWAGQNMVILPARAF